ncbi:unnamed protein product [Linum tenue]|uniref:Uncharacterized protein n=1 Tax=Linum tenue TaxID=586396 RepID=A0AAV0JTX7_9ROSI|nr:unnamed protein product [Linum tenue]
MATTLCSQIVRSRALEARWDLLVTNIEKQAQRDRNVEVDPKNVGLNGCAKAESRFKINKPANQTAARLHRRVPKGDVEQRAEDISTNAQFECVNRAFLGRRAGSGSRLGMRRWRACLGWWRRRRRALGWWWWRRWAGLFGGGGHGGRSRSWFRVRFGFGSGAASAAGCGHGEEEEVKDKEEGHG